MARRLFPKLVRGRLLWTPPQQAAAQPPPFIPDAGKALAPAWRRRIGALSRRGRNIVPVRSQVNPPYPFAEVVQPRRLRGMLARRGRLVQPPWPQQQAAQPPPLPLGAARQPAASRRYASSRRRRQPGVSLPAADQPATPSFPRPRRLALLAVRRGRLPQPPPGGDAPPPLQVSRRVPVRPPVSRRSRITQVPPAAVTPSPPAYPPQAVRVRVRPGLLRHGRLAQPPWPQLAAAQPPPYPPQAIRSRVRPGLLRRGHVVQPPWPQATPAVTPWIPQPVLARRARPVPLRHGRCIQPVAGQAHPVPVVQQRPRLRPVPRVCRSRYIVPVRPQVNPPYPHAVISQPRRLRGVRLRRGRAFEVVRFLPPPPFTVGMLTAADTTAATLAAAATSAALTGTATSARPASGDAALGRLTTTDQRGGPS